MRKLLLKVTGGFPMTYSDEWCCDYWHWVPVDLYVDRLGRKWLATGPWDMRRERLREKT